MNENFELDCEIIRALKSGEMARWFGCMRRFHMNNDALSKRYDWFKKESPDEYRKKVYDELKEDYDGSIMIDGRNQ